MRKPAWVGIVLLIHACSLAAAPAEQAKKASPTVTSAQWQEDLRYFAKELPKRHKNLFHTMSQEQFEQAVAGLEKDIPSLAEHQIVVRLSQITGMVGDGHTGVHLPLTFRLYPLALFWFGNDLRVTAAVKEYERALGTRVVRIGGLSIDEVKSRVGTCFPAAANENEWYVLNTSPAFLGRAEVLHALGVVPEVERASFTFQNDAGEEFILDVSPVVPDGTLRARMLRVAPSEPLTRQKWGETFWHTYLPETRTVYLSFRGYDSLGKKARDLYRFIDKNPVDRLVIDMRQNGGGDFFVGREHLVDPIKERPALNQKGKLFVITGRYTFSAAMVNAIDFHKQTNATLVGEPPGERPNSYSENDEMTLPNSRLVVSYSTRYYQFLDQDVPAFLPDHRIDPSWEAHKSGRDPVMEWILASTGG